MLLSPYISPSPSLPCPTVSIRLFPMSVNDNFFDGETRFPSSSGICPRQGSQLHRIFVKMRVNKNPAECLAHLGDEPFWFVWYCERFLGSGVDWCSNLQSPRKTGMNCHLSNTQWALWVAMAMDSAQGWVLSWHQQLFDFITYSCIRHPILSISVFHF